MVVNKIPTQTQEDKADSTWNNDKLKPVLDGYADKINEISEILNIDFVYPVGSIYTSVTDTNPSILFGGTWVEFSKGRVLVGVDSSQTEFNTVKKVGGAKTHSLTAKENGPHNHKLHMAQNAGPYASPPFGSGGYEWVDSTNVVSLSGEGAPHNNLQPYITVYMWERTK